MRVLAGFLLVISLAACPKKSTTTTPPTGGDTGSAAGSAAGGSLPDVPFEQLDHDQKIEFMKTKVVPAMEPIFKEHDAEEFKDFGCKTCHDDAGVDRGEFHMPNDSLPKLNFANMKKFKKEDIEWMSNIVKPTMAKLLKEPEYSQDNPQGFGCLHCHTEQK